MNLLTFILLLVVISVLLLIPTKRKKTHQAQMQINTEPISDSDDFGIPEEDFDPSRLTLSKR